MSQEGLFQNPGNTWVLQEVKRDIEGRRREAITGNLNDYFRHRKKGGGVREKKSGVGKRKEKQECGFALKRFCRGGVCLDVNLRSSVVYVERDFW